MSIFEEPKVDCHNHILDPLRFPYANDISYRPSGQEIGTLAQHRSTMNAYGVQHALVVGPNSGYGTDNSCLLNALASSNGRYKGIAVVSNNIGYDELLLLRASGVVGIAFNLTIYGRAYYDDCESLLRLLSDLDLFVQVQAEHDQIVGLVPMLLRSGVRILIDHCGRPTPKLGLPQAGFQSVLELGRSGRAAVKLSGYQKFSAKLMPYDDALPFVTALMDAFTLDCCLWASDWPYLKATERLDYGPLLKHIESWLPDASDRRRVLWDTPCRLFGFGN